MLAPVLTLALLPALVLVLVLVLLLAHVSRVALCASARATGARTGACASARADACASVFFLPLCAHRRGPGMFMQDDEPATQRQRQSLSDADNAETVRMDWR